jgi:hypothetical protein
MAAGTRRHTSMALPNNACASIKLIKKVETLGNALPINGMIAPGFDAMLPVI